MPKNIIPRKVASMNEIKNNKIVQHNDLITGAVKMDSAPLKFFELAVACLDTEQAPENRTVCVSKELLFSFFNAKSGSKHTYFRELLVSLQNNSNFYVRKFNAEKQSDEHQIIATLEKTYWSNSGDEVYFQFTESIIPYLVELKKNFTQYLLSDIGRLDSKYSIILYKWLSMNFNQYEHYKNKGNRTQKQLEKFKNPVISAEDIRRMTDTENKYKRPADFFKRVIDTAVEEIAEKTIFNVEYTQERKGNRFHAINFYIDKKQVVKNEFYKEEQQDPAFLEEQEKEEQTEDELYNKAIKSNYATLLGDYGLIKIKDIQDKELMAGLQKNVFPLYDKLEQQKGIGSVDKHVSYVASRKKDYSKRNIVRYLQVAIENYLPDANKGFYK